MKLHLNRLIYVTFFLVAGPLAAQAHASTELKVTLFGTPCTLSGPLGVQGLKAVHAVSPEQALPTIEASDLQKASKQIKRALESVRAAKPVPAALDRYRERLTKRLEALGAFSDAWVAAKAQRKSAPLIAAGQKYSQGKDAKPFEQLAKKVEAGVSADLAEQLFDLYSSMIEPDPEEDFHRAIERINVRYSCTFEEPSDEEVE